MSDYQRWLRERELEQMAWRGMTAQPQRPTLEGDVVVPALQAVAIALAGGLASGVVVLLFGFGTQGWARWALAAKALGAAFVFVLLGCIVTFVLQHRRTVKDPLDLQQKRLELALRAVQPHEPEEPNYVIVRTAARQLAATVDHEVKQIGPATDPATERLYKFITRVWPTGKISRRHCASLGFSRKTWEKYVGGVRGKEGQESGRGLLDRAEVVTKGPNGWEIVAPLSDALQVTEALAEYAEGMAQIVAGRDGLGPGRDNTGGNPQRPRPEG